LISAKIIDASFKRCGFEVIQSEKTEKTAPPLHIAIAPTKNIDRFEFFLEKCTEIGISEITPIICFHSERKTIKAERLNKIIVSACKQSKNFHFPVFNPLSSLTEIINSGYKRKFIAHCDFSEKIELKTFKIKEPTLILIGPEGDFSKKEIELAIKNGFESISLGNSRLRTETAGIVACTTINLNYEKQF
jgi:16S rRNA (uracil1498-N3)-methyltransferase